MTLLYKYENLFYQPIIDRVVMKAEILQRATFSQVAALHEVYSNLVDIYEDILQGPRNCVGIPEYYAAKHSRDLCYKRIIEIQDSL